MQVYLQLQFIFIAEDTENIIITNLNQSINGMKEILPRPGKMYRQTYCIYQTKMSSEVIATNIAAVIAEESIKHRNAQIHYIYKYITFNITI